jgi:ribonuclease D
MPARLLSPAGVPELAAQARAAGRFGIDTEFVGEGRYRPLLCVVQIAVPDGDDVRAEVIDALDPELDPTALAEVLAAPEVDVVFHAGRQDVALLRRTWRTDVTSIFDVQLAAGFAGLGSQVSYENVLRSVLGVRLGKTASFTRWEKRPLTPEQVSYAREDVLHILELHDALRDRLSERGRLEWALEESRALETASDARDEETIFERLPKIAALDPRTRAVARELVAWREETARGADKPVSSILSEPALVEIARRRPSNRSALEQLRGVHPGSLRRRGQDILDAVARGEEREPLPGERSRRPPPHPDDAGLIVLAEALVRARAGVADVAYELVASRADLQEIVRAVRDGGEEPDVRTLRGWRRELAGEELLELLRGKGSLGIGPGLRLEIRPD